jgi:hypothetical protein
MLRHINTQTIVSKRKYYFPVLFFSFDINNRLPFGRLNILSELLTKL